MNTNGVVFGKGFLGQRIARKMRFELTGTDISNIGEVEDYLAMRSPEVVINCAGKTGKPNIDWCESHKEETFMSNVIGAANLGITCSRAGIYFVHLGTGGIYTGENGGRGFTEEDEPNFYEQTYARTKILAEKILKEFPCLQIRINMPLDCVPHEKNLVDKLKNYKKVADIKCSISTVPHMMHALEELIEKRRTGIYNVTNPGVISLVDIMKMYKEIVNPAHEFDVISREELDRMTLKKRADGTLDTTKLSKDGIKMPDIREAVHYCLEEYNKYLHPEKRQ